MQSVGTGEANPRTSSRTALGVTALRAYHQVFDGSPKILEDAIAERLLDGERRATLASDSAFSTDAAVQLRLAVLVRSRYAEERLEAAVRTGCRQFVVLGAGFDTFAFRQPGWASALQIFEVDHPATQTEKRNRLARAGLDEPRNVAFAPIDFERTSLPDGLTAAGFDPGARSFFSWLGVMMYLTRGAIDEVLAYVASLGTGTELCFSYARPAPPGRPAPAAVRAAKLGEPWLSAFEPGELEPLMRRHGFTRVELLRPAEANRRYRPEGSSLPPFARTNVGWACV